MERKINIRCKHGHIPPLQFAILNLIKQEEMLLNTQ